MKIITTNKSASFEYFIEEKYEAGIVLEGNEIKSLRQNSVNMNDSFCFVRGNTVSVSGPSERVTASCRRETTTSWIGSVRRTKSGEAEFSTEISA